MGQVTCALRLHESSVKQILDIGLLKGLFLQVQSPRAWTGRRRRNVSLIRLDHQGISVLGAAALAEQPSAVELLGEFVSWQGDDSIYLDVSGDVRLGVMKMNWKFDLLNYTYPHSYTHSDILKNTYLLTILHDWLGSKLLNSTASIVLWLNPAETSRQWERFIRSQLGWLGWSDSTTRCANFKVSAANCSCMAKAGYQACSIQPRPRCEH